MDTTTFAKEVAENSAAAAENLAENFVPIVSESVVSTQTQKFESYSADDMAKAREQEKQKLYPTVEKLKEERDQLRKERDERDTADIAQKTEAAAEAKKRAEAEMDVRSLLEQKEMEWSQQLDAERMERERAFALLDQERQYQEVQTYRHDRLEAERDNIIPELVDLISGSNSDEIEASIANLKERSERILESAQQAMTSARRDMAGSRVTAPSSGPLDTDTGNQSFTPEDIRNMSISDYQKYRERLLGTAASSRGRGLFG
jgi:hypothetical protein